ncbi:ATP-binding protein [Roseateles chitinivorans]|uniref:ATP-binding protein n=1 Tax=Roseateles chitinivorans TaxID=2917965 RepID=UPI003D665CCD
MNAPALPWQLQTVSPTLADIALARLAPASADDDAAPEARWLCALRAAQSDLSPLTEALRAWSESPPEADAALHRLSRAMSLAPVEQLALALALAVDTDPLTARAVAWLQAPLREMRPTAGLVAALHAGGFDNGVGGLAALLDGIALRSGLLRLTQPPDRTLPDCALSVPTPVVLAAAGATGHWSGVVLKEPGNTAEDSGATGAQLPPSLQAQAERHARELPALGGMLVVRSAHPLEARRAAAAVVGALGRRAAFIEGTRAEPGLAAWLLLLDAVPVFCTALAPGERQPVPSLSGYPGPMIVATGLDGSWSRDGDPPAGWSVELPTADERVALWTDAGLDQALAASWGHRHRHAAARITQLSRAASAWADLPTDQALHHASRRQRSELGTLAEALTDDVPDEALVLPPALRAALEGVLRRCHFRDGLAEGLGPAVRTRYRPGVRALLVGPSGTGKTLAAGWLATRLSLPLYRVDLAAVTSKYIGETEKNLSELFARAEHDEVVLLFDEADSLFGKRTDVKDAHDRFANQQTNYLLQRIEAYDGIVLLTSNSRGRFDSAFTRRLDAIVEFPAPAAEERRALWLAHLGDAHRLDAAGLNRIAATCELAGGHIRNVVLAARAAALGGPIDARTLDAALVAEYRKLGKAPPAGLTARDG